MLMDNLKLVQVQSQLLNQYIASTRLNLPGLAMDDTYNGKSMRIPASQLEEEKDMPVSPLGAIRRDLSLEIEDPSTRGTFTGNLSARPDFTQQRSAGLTSRSIRRKAPRNYLAAGGGSSLMMS